MVNNNNKNKMVPESRTTATKDGNHMKEKKINNEIPKFQYTNNNNSNKKKKRKRRKKRR